MSKKGCGFVSNSHPYGVEHKQRARVYFGLAIISILVTVPLSKGIDLLNISGIIKWFELPSVLGFYWILVKIFDVYIWRLKIIQRLKIVQIPDLNGEWIGELKSSHNETKKHGKLIIKQTWQQISINLHTDTSRSRSLMADIREDEYCDTVLSFEYHSETLQDAEQTMNDHNGFNVFTINKELNVLEGEYFTCRKRQTCGTMKFHRKLSRSGQKKEESPTLVPSM